MPGTTTAVLCGYNARNRLASENKPDRTVLTSWGCDAAGNRRSETERHYRHGEYDAQDRLQTYGATTCTLEGTKTTSYSEGLPAKRSLVDARDDPLMRMSWVLQTYELGAVPLRSYSCCAQNPLVIRDSSGLAGSWAIVELVKDGGIKILEWVKARAAKEARERLEALKEGKNAGHGWTKSRRKMAEEISREKGGGGNSCDPEKHGNGEWHIHATDENGEHLDVLGIFSILGIS